MTDIDKELEEAMVNAGPWNGDADKLWTRVEGGIRRRRARNTWVLRLAPVAAAAVVLVAVWGNRPGGTPVPPTIVEGPAKVVQEPVRPGPARREPATGYTLPLPVYLGTLRTIALGQVVAVADTSVPCVDAHGGPPCDPFPAKIYTVELIRAYKGTPGQTFRVRQLVPSERVVHADGKPDPLMQLGGSYLFFFNDPTDGIYQEIGTRFELGADNRLRSVREGSVLEELSGFTPDEMALKLDSLLSGGDQR